MSNAIEDAMRFRAMPGGYKLREDQRACSNDIGYSIVRVRPQAPYHIRRGAKHQPEQFDVYRPDGAWMAVEPTLWWAMKRADLDYILGGRR